MVEKQVTIRVTATDQASPAFKTIGANAKAMGSQVSTSATQSAASLKTMQDRGAAVGAAMGALVGGVAIAGRAFVAQEQQIRGLNRAYGESSIEMQKFAESMQKTTTFSNDAARAAEMTASTLIRNYGFTATEIQKLITISADLAATSGLTLEDATQRVSAAMRGEAESAEVLGLTLNQQSIDRNNLTLTMTNQEAAHFRLNALIEQSAFANGAAAEAADTNAGKAKQFVNVLQDQVQGLGEASGAMGQYLSVMGNLALALPLVTGMLGKFAVGLGALGLGGKSGIAIGALAFGGYEAYRTYSGQGLAATGTSPELSAWNAFFGQASELMNAIIPFGDPYDTGRYRTAKGANAVEDVTKNLFYIDPLSTPEGSKEFGNYLYERLYTAGLVSGADSRGDKDEQLDMVRARASQAGLSLEDYIRAYLTAPGSNFVFDPVSGTYMDKGEIQIYTQERTRIKSEQIGSMATGGVGYPGTGGLEKTLLIPPVSSTVTTDRLSPYDTGGTMGSFSNFGKAAEDAAALSAALVEQYGAYAGLVEGINSADDAQKAFKATQDGLLQQEGVYSQQINEFSSQVSAQDAAYEILNQRREEGQALTESDIEFLDNYAQANERGTGAVEDATVEMGKLAQAYLLNMEKGDAMNETLGETAGSIDDLVTVIEDLILSLDGVPEEVRTRIELERADEALEAARQLNYELSLIAGTYVANIVLNQSGGNAPSGPQYLGGGTMNAYAGGGTQYGGGHALVGERGPELVWLPNGAQVTNTEATKSRMGGRSRGGGGPNFYGPVTLQMSTPDVYDALASQALGGAR